MDERYPDAMGSAPEAPPPHPPHHIEENYGFDDGNDTENDTFIDSGVGVGMTQQQQQRKGAANGMYDDTKSFDDNRALNRDLPPSQGSKRYTKEQMEAIKEYRDVEQTGKWGAISKREIMAVALIILLAIVGTIVAVVVTRHSGGGDDEVKAAQSAPKPAPKDAPTVPTLAPSERPSSSPTASPQPVGPTPAPMESTSAPTSAPTTFEFRAVPGFAKIKDASIDYDFSEYDDITSLRNKFYDTQASPQARAASWSIYLDTQTPVASPSFVERYALCVLYFTTQGNGWTDKTNWLSPSSNVCDWYGVECTTTDDPNDEDFFPRVEELNLFKNNLVNSLPFELSKLKSLKTLRLSRNSLEGPIQSDLFEAMKDHLVFLYLDFNELEGNLPLFIDDDSALDTITLFGNEITGKVDEYWCNLQLSIDCSTVDCECCAWYDLCF